MNINTAHAFLPSPSRSLLPSRFHAVFVFFQMSRKIQFEYRVFFNPLVEMNKLTMNVNKNVSQKLSGEKYDIGCFSFPLNFLLKGYL